MKKNRYFAITVVILAILAIFLTISSSRSTFRKGQSDFAVDDTSNVTKIFMSDKNNNTVTLTRVSAGSWLVDEKFPASKFNVEMLLGTMLNIQVKETVAKAARNTVIRDMAANSVKVEIYQWKYRIRIFHLIRLFPHETLSKVYYVGGAIQSNRGSYMLMEHSSQPYVLFLPGLRGFVSPIYSPIEKYWRDYSVFKKNIAEIKAIRVEFPGDPSNSFVIVNNNSHSAEMHSLAGDQPIRDADTLRMLNYLSSFRNINFETILNDMDKTRKDSILATIPYCQITLTDTANRVFAAKMYRKGAAPGAVDDFGKPAPYDIDRLYALVNKGNDFVMVQYFVFDKILRPKSFFIQKPGGPVKK